MGVKPLLFLREVREELQKVTWPNRQKTIRLTGVVILISLFVGLYIGALDFALTKMMSQIVQK